MVISGCSGGGKSTLVAELARRGFAAVEEPGRRIVRAETAGAGAALPWVDPVAFLRRAVETALADRAAAAGLKGWVFFDRGLIDAAAGLQDLTGEPALGALAEAHRYHRRVFLTPPWREIYENDAERRHDFEAGAREYRRLLKAFPALGYAVIVLPKVGVAERADIILQRLADEPEP